MPSWAYTMPGHTPLKQEVHPLCCHQHWPYRWPIDKPLCGELDTVLKIERHGDKGMKLSENLFQPNSADRGCVDGMQREMGEQVIDCEVGVWRHCKSMRPKWHTKASRAS